MNFSAKLGLQFGLFVGGYTLVQMLFANYRGVHDFWNCVSAGTVSGGCAGYILGVKRRRFGFLMYGAVFGTVLGVINGVTEDFSRRVSPEGLIIPPTIINANSS